VAPIKSDTIRFAALQSEFIGCDDVTVGVEVTVIVSVALMIDPSVLQLCDCARDHECSAGTLSILDGSKQCPEP